MSDALEAEVKTNPQGDPITSAAPAPSPKEGGRKDPHAEAKKTTRGNSRIYVF